jgi:hypothetical protein
MNTFHANGAKAYRSAIRAKYESQKQDLEHRLRQANSAQERSRLAEELRDLETNFRAETARWGKLLF